MRTAAQSTQQEAPAGAPRDLRHLGAHITRLARMAAAEHMTRAALLAQHPPALRPPAPGRPAARDSAWSLGALS
ncbi:MAG: hypothetical protein C0475_06825 [Planctomyces sp.]|nr:hypothetical protein [Planctomyces sp.]MBA4039351.1 hypothetical protein [Planctomyces sp.]MBA4119875.1 hypothetical protein [Isosphaera sp.]